jgi:2-amino-4-hydroxy-6-hydroxymethyldihydropteridine diphosphokinase
MTNLCYILLGSDTGDKKENIGRCFKEISKISVCPPRISSIYETEPWGFNSQEMFFNAAVELKTKLTPYELLDYLLETEKRMGRERGEERYVSRVIDADILFFGDLIMNDERLEIPHPRLHLRRFALVPMSELNPDLVHPVLKKNVSELLKELNDPLIVKKTLFSQTIF